MKDVTIISTSNRLDNKSMVFAEHCVKLLEDQGVNVRLFSLQDMPDVLSSLSMYDFANSPMLEIVEKYLRPVDKVVFIIPEYNGSFPGILKLFIDAIHPSHFAFKKAALIGISSGRAGNVRGMDHLTAVLNYVKTDVFHHKLPISRIDRIVHNGEITDPTTINRMRVLMEDFLKF